MIEDQEKKEEASNILDPEKYFEELEKKENLFDENKSSTIFENYIKENNKINYEDKILQGEKIMNESIGTIKKEEDIKKHKKFDFFFFFKENEEMLESSKSLINKKEIYHLFFDAKTKTNFGPVFCFILILLYFDKKVYLWILDFQ